MRNNRQVGLDGKVFLTSCLKRSSIYVIGVILYGIIMAVADVMKLTGKSGIAMSSLTSALVSIDLIVSLLFVVVVFYAYFLECGSSIPVLREKPLIILGYCRLAYDVLLCYYIIYRAMYCIVNRSEVPFGILAFYTVYMVVAFVSILTCCFIINVISRNMIRRIYIKSLKNLAIVGMIFTSLMPLMYIIARFWIGEIGDEYFTASFCDLLRLCIAPIAYLCVWIVLIKARTVTAEVFGEVDAAIRDRRYQISYTDKSKESEEKGESRRLKNSKAKAAAAAATVAAIEADTAVQQALTAGKIAGTEKNTVTPANDKKSEVSSENVYPQQIITENIVKTKESKIKDEKLRKAVSEAVEKAIKEDENSVAADAANQNKSNAEPKQKMPVMDFDPYAQTERKQDNQQGNRQQKPVNNRTVQGNVQQRPNQNKPAQAKVQQRPNQNRPVQNNAQQRSNQGRPVQNNNQQRQNVQNRVQPGVNQNRGNTPQRPVRPNQNQNQRKKH